MRIWLTIHCAAVAFFTKVMSRITPGYANGHYSLGNALYKLGKREKAIYSYIKALRIKPDYGEAYNNLGNVLYDLGNYNEALRHYMKAFDLAPDRMDSWHKLARILSNVSVQKYSPRWEKLFF